MLRILLCAAFLAPFGPPRQTEVAIQCDLRPWSLQVQQEDGSWDADRVPEGIEGFVRGRPEDDVAVTSLMALCLLGDGHTASQGSDRSSVASALAWLASRQSGTGRIGRQDHERALHHHALATLVLSENLYLGGEPDRSAQARKAVSFLEQAAYESGGWSASGRVDDPVDPVTTAWASMALRSAMDAKLTDSSPAAGAAVAWFGARCDPKGGLFRASGDAEEDLKATLCALLTRHFAGETIREAKGFATSLDAIIAGRPEWREDPEYYYLASVAAYRTGGRHWKAWTKVLKRSVVDTWRGGGADRERTPGLAPVDGAAPVPGSLGSTAFSILCLEVYFRYARIVGAR